MTFDILKAIILGIVEGLTEFVPVSSTGHLLLVQRFFGFADEDFGKTFAVLIQFGAILALLSTLVLIFAFQAENILGKAWHVVLIAIPILIQVYLNAGVAYGAMHWLRVPYPIAAPGALIGASNFFELAVATAIALFGPESGAALATVVGVLVEVPVMLSVCAACNRTRHWFPMAPAETSPSGQGGLRAQRIIRQT